MDDVPDDIVSELVDLSEVDLVDLAELDNPVLAATVQRIRREVDHPGQALAGHQSAL
jgi:FXSXX-COOH protein